MEVEETTYVSKSANEIYRTPRLPSLSSLVPHVHNYCFVLSCLIESDHFDSSFVF